MSRDQEMKKNREFVNEAAAARGKTKLSDCVFLVSQILPVKLGQLYIAVYLVTC